MAYDVTLNAGFGKISATALDTRPQLPIVTDRSALLRARNDGNLPVFDSGMAFNDIGNSGLRQFAGWIREEFLPQLQGREAARVYREMQDNSSVVGAMIFAINAAIRRVDWSVEPADDSPEAAHQAEFVDGCRDDMSHTWSDFVTESLSMLGYGYAPHEIVYKRSMGKRPGIDPATKRPAARSNFDDGMIRWRRLPLRGQDTVLKWFFGPSGEILGMTQQPWNAPIVDLPIEKMLLFRTSVHKGNPEGRSILRTAYRSYYLAKRMEELESIMFERMGGIPMISVPKSLLDDAANGIASAKAAVETYKRMVTNVRIDEQMGLIIPSDTYETQAGGAQYKFELVTPQGGRGQAVDSDKAISRYNVNIMASVMADFLQLGHESRGTQALATSKVDMFFQSIEGFIGSNCDVLNRHGIPRLCDLNGMDPLKNPKITTEMPQRMDLDVLSNFVLRLNQAGMPIFPNETLQAFLLESAGMPDVSDDDAYKFLTDTKMDMVQMGSDAARQAAEGKDETQNDGTDAAPQGRTDLQKMLAGSIIRRLIKHNTAKGTTVSKRRRRPHKHAA